MNNKPSYYEHLVRYAKAHGYKHPGSKSMKQLVAIIKANS